MLAQDVSSTMNARLKIHSSAKPNLRYWNADFGLFQSSHDLAISEFALFLVQILS
jgi:hypothetical protein